MAASIRCYDKVAPCTCKDDVSASVICHLYRFILVLFSGFARYYRSGLALKLFNVILFLMLVQYARGFLELFLHLGMALMDTCLKSHREDVCKILKTLQTATRVLQIVCTESKVSSSV